MAIQTCRTLARYLTGMADLLLFWSEGAFSLYVILPGPLWAGKQGRQDLGMTSEIDVALLCMTLSAACTPQGAAENCEDWQAFMRPHLLVILCRARA